MSSTSAADSVRGENLKDIQILCPHIAVISRNDPRFREFELRIRTSKRPDFEVHLEIGVFLEMTFCRCFVGHSDVVPVQP